MAEYLRRVPDDVGVHPRALVVMEKVVTIQNNPAPPLLYDYYGFPESTYRITFPAPGAPEIATRISELLKAAGIERTYDHSRGLDHGVFIPLKVAYPKADVPIVQVSLLASMDPAEHIRLGQAPARGRGYSDRRQRHELPQHADIQVAHARQQRASGGRRFTAV
jgi:aromatic ring-opening dioxygenase catalytic subunit (LigB family)